MKSLRYLLISALALLATNEAFACWDYICYEPRGYYMYRVYDSAPTPKMAIENGTPNVKANCLGWQKLTSESIPLEDIYKVVYSMSLSDFEKIYDNRNATFENKFAEWITKKDTAILDFLHLAKTNEYLRLRHASRWYYPTMKTGARMTLEEVANKALSATDARLRDRNLLQAIRALFSLNRFEECIALWNNEASKFPTDNLMRRLIQSYVAGSEFRFNNTSRAMEYYAQAGDVRSLYYCAKKLGHQITKVENLELICRYAPNSIHIVKTLQEYIREIEPSGSYWDHELKTTREERLKWLRPFCLKMARNRKVENPALWYYTAAFLSDLAGETATASSQLSLAEKATTNDYLSESIKVFRIYLDAKLSKYDSAYEAKLLGQLKWLDEKIANNINEEVIAITANEYSQDNGISYYYWNDMLRRILLAEVCPRMLKAGKSTRALQLANMADNRLSNLVGKYGYGREFRNHFFEMADSLGATTVKQYVQNVCNPTSEYDRYLNERGYTNKDYLNDIVGTQSLREMRYDEAVKYLAKVSDSYRPNVIMQFNPFSVAPKKIEESCDTRYEFAKEMHSLEQAINSETDPNIKAQKMLKFAVGMCNSFDRSWPLVHYYRGRMFYGSVCEKRDWENDKYTKAAIDRSKKMMATACNMATDEEVAANINYELCNFKTIADKYPNTEKGALVRGKCDKLHDYHVERKYPAYRNNFGRRYW